MTSFLLGALAGIMLSCMVFFWIMGEENEKLRELYFKEWLQEEYKDKRN